MLHTGWFYEFGGHLLCHPHLTFVHPSAGPDPALKTVRARQQLQEPLSCCRALRGPRAQPLRSTRGEPESQGGQWLRPIPRLMSRCALETGSANLKPEAGPSGSEGDAPPPPQACTLRSRRKTCLFRVSRDQWQEMAFPWTLRCLPPPPTTPMHLRFPQIPPTPSVPEPGRGRGF